VSVFERFGAEWSQTHRFGTQNPLQWEQFKASIAIDGGVAVIGSPTYGGPNGIPAAHGRATIMRRGSQWNRVFEKTLDPVDSTAQRKFGGSVTISGTRIVVGAPGAADAVGGHRGGAYVFEKPFGAATWSQKGTLLPNSLDHGQDFGRGVALALNQVWVSGNREVLCFAFGDGTWDFMTEVSVPFPDLGSGPSYPGLLTKCCFLPRIGLSRRESAVCGALSRIEVAISSTSRSIRVHLRERGQTAAASARAGAEFCRGRTVLRVHIGGARESAS